MSPLRLRPTPAAERFAAALDGAVAPADLPAALAPLTLVARRLATVDGPVMDPAASARIRQRLVAVAAVQGAGPAETTAVAGRPVSRRVRRLTSVAVGSVAGVTAVAGVAIGASNSLPGDPFYGLKRAAEQVQLDLAGSPADKGRRELEFASTRLAELRAIGIRDPHAPGLLRDMRTEVAAANTDLTTAARADHSRAPLNEFETTTHQQVQGLLGLVKSAPAAVLPQLEGTVTSITHLQQAVRSLGVTLPPLPGGGRNPLPGPGATPRRSSSANPTQSPTSHPRQSSGSHPSSGGVFPSIGSSPHRSGEPGTQSSKPSPGRSVKVPTKLPTLPTKLPTKISSLLPSPVTSVLHSLLPSLPASLGGKLPGARSRHHSG